MQSQLIHVVVNGESKQVPERQSIAELLTALQVGSDRVAIELNKSIVRKRDWNATTVADGSEIEIVEFVGGG